MQSSSWLQTRTVALGKIRLTRDGWLEKGTMANREFWRRWVIGEFSVGRVATSALLIYAIVCAYAYFFTDGAIFLPQPSSYSDTDEVLKLTSGEGVQISALYFPNSEARYTLLYSHGNAEDLGDIRPRLLELRDIGFSVLAYDYRGYGTSEGTPTERNTYKDIDAAYRYLRETLEIPGDRIIAYGRSVGGGPAVDLAMREPLGGLILESTFVSAFRVVTRIAIVPFDKFNNLAKIDRVNCPVLVMHGTADEVIPFGHGKRLFAAAKEPKRSVWIEGAGHNNLRWIAGDRYATILTEFREWIQP